MTYKNLKYKHMKHLLLTFAILLSQLFSFGQNQFEKDVIKTSAGDISITFFGHGSLSVSVGSKIIYVDPVSTYADYSKLPKASMILVTHDHFDHMDVKAIAQLETKSTSVVANSSVVDSLKRGIALKNGEKKTFDGIVVEAVPAYNTSQDKLQFHPKGRDNGYVITINGKRIYVASDTENIPEMSSLKDIDVAFLPMNLPYTMTPQQVAEATRVINPGILYPYHYGETDVMKFQELLNNNKKTEVRIRKMK